LLQTLERLDGRRILLGGGISVTCSAFLFLPSCAMFNLSHVEDRMEQTPADG
jgi:hypothetical protein